MLVGVPKFLSNDVSTDEDYIKAADWIEEGSILDRRRDSDDRRTLSGRRTKFKESSYDEERRQTNFKRRDNKDRRQQKIESIRSDNQKQSYSSILTKGHYKIIGLIERFSVSIKLKEFSSIDKYIDDFSKIIRSFSHREDLIFYAYLDKLNNQTNEQVNEMLMTLNLYIYKSGEEILEILNQYKNTEFDDSKLESLVQDLDKITEILTTSYKHKDEFLYSKYRQIPNF